MTCGIYMIRNTVNGKRYIGASRNIESRWEAHRNQLNGVWAIMHHNGELNDDWRRYGETAFEFVVVEEISNVDTLTERENYWIDHPYEAGVYNRVKRGVYAHMREIVRVVAEADNSDGSVCCQLCDVRFVWDEHDDNKSEMIHRTPCVVKKARALLGLDEGA